ncbi:hypothetical protein ABE10_11550, partial [Bacillus toyonensis]|nr:hypothetical protein [Bacillus toyonensis]
AVHVDEAQVELTGHPRIAVAQVDHGPVGGHDRALLGDAGVLGQLRVRDEVPVLAVHGEHVPGLQDVVAVEQLASCRVSGDVDARIGLVHHVRTELGQAVDHAVDRVLVPGDQAGGQDHRVTGAGFDRVVEVRHPAQHRHRLALRAGGHVDDLVVGQIARLFVVDQHVTGDLEIAQLLCDRHVPDHAPAEEGDATTMRVGGVDDLLDAMHVAGEARHDNAARRLADHLVEHGTDRALERREPGDVGVRGVDEEQVDPLLAETGEGTEIGQTPVERELVHLEVARRQHESGLRPDRDGQSVGDGMVDRHELEVERADLLALPLGDRQGEGLDAMLLELRLHQREGQA